MTTLYNSTALAKHLPDIGLTQADIAADNPRNKYNNHQERVLRALSWHRAAERYTKDHDMRLVCALLSFNAMYTQPPQRPPLPADAMNAKTDERRFMEEEQVIGKFVDNVVRCDSDKVLLRFLKEEQRDDFELLLANQYLFKYYWKAFVSARNYYENTKEPHGFRAIHKQTDKNTEVEVALEENNAAPPLKEILMRVRVLRNQIMHGESGYGDYYNRPQTKLCAHFMPPLIGRMLWVMISKPNARWGKVPYPPQGEGPNVYTPFPRPLQDPRT